MHSNHPQTPHNTRQHLLNTLKATHNCTPRPKEALTLSREVDECEPLLGGVCCAFGDAPMNFSNWRDFGISAYSTAHSNCTVGPCRLTPG
jgi:hypothetical protein